MADAKRPTLPLTGGCPCGAIRYEVTDMPLALYACHCTDCQRKSGSAQAWEKPLRPLMANDAECFDTVPDSAMPLSEAWRAKFTDE